MFIDFEERLTVAKFFLSCLSLLDELVLFSSETDFIRDSIIEAWEPMKDFDTAHPDGFSPLVLTRRILELFETTIPSEDQHAVDAEKQSQGNLNWPDLRTNSEPYTLETVDHGQVVGYDGDDPIKTALNGLTRIGTHSKYGFGEFRVKPIEKSRGKAM